MPGYAERTKRIEFPELGDDIWVDIRNPLLLTLEPDAWDKLTAEDRRAARYGRWIKAWNVYGIDDNGDPSDDLLGPPSVETLRHAPIDVLNRIWTEVQKWSDPLARTTAPSTTGSPSSLPSSSPTAPTPETATTSPSS